MRQCGSVLPAGFCSTDGSAGRVLLCWWCQLHGAKSAEPVPLRVVLFQRNTVRLSRGDVSSHCRRQLHLGLHRVPGWVLLWGGHRVASAVWTRLGRDYAMTLSSFIGVLLRQLVTQAVCLAGLPSGDWLFPEARDGWFADRLVCWWRELCACSKECHVAGVVFTLFCTCALNFQVYCPANSSTTQQVPNGYYPTGTSGQRSGIALCAAGSYCSGGAVYPCASGRVGTTQGASNSLCDAPCPAGKAPCAAISICSCIQAVSGQAGSFHGCELFCLCWNAWEQARTAPVALLPHCRAEMSRCTARWARPLRKRCHQATIPTARHLPPRLASCCALRDVLQRRTSNVLHRRILPRPDR